jgi:hypothetical protein
MKASTIILGLAALVASVSAAPQTNGLQRGNTGGKNNNGGKNNTGTGGKGAVKGGAAAGVSSLLKSTQTT